MGSNNASWDGTELVGLGRNCDSRHESVWFGRSSRTLVSAICPPEMSELFQRDQSEDFYLGISHQSSLPRELRPRAKI